jgi:predicted nuclease with TOPRIM domain
MLAELKKKINRLISLYETTNSEKDAVIKEKTELQAIINEKNNKIKELEKRIETLQLANAFKAGSLDQREAKQKVERIVREIERCIAMLNN